MRAACRRRKRIRGEPHADGGGFDIVFEVPIYDFGRAKTREAEQRYLEAVNRLGARAVNARSEARQAYAAYKASYAIAAQYEHEVLPLRQHHLGGDLAALQRHAGGRLRAARGGARQGQGGGGEHRGQARTIWLAATDLSVAVLGGGRVEGGAVLATSSSRASE